MISSLPMLRRDLTALLIPFVYFIAGATTLAGVATTFYYKEDLGLTIPQAQILASISIIPWWFIKPLCGFFFDRFPLRRKQYLFLSGILSASGYFSLATWVVSFFGALVATFIAGIGLALADVIVDAIVAERSRTQVEAGKLQSICRTSFLAGALIVSYPSGILAEMIGARNVFFITGMLPLLTSFFALFIRLKISTSHSSYAFRETWQKFRKALTPTLIWSALFLFLWRATPTSGGAFNYFLIDEFHFSREFFGRLSLLSHISGIAGVFFFRKVLIAMPLKKLFFWIVIASVVLSLPTLGLVYGWYEVLGMSPHLFAMADTLVTGPLTEIGFLPLLVLVARICPKGIEATMFAILASLMNIGLTVSDMGGAFLSSIYDIRQAGDPLGMNYAHLDTVLWIAILSSFLPLPFLRFLPETRVGEEMASPSTEAPLETPLNPSRGGIV